MITSKEKALLHIYATAADLTDHGYRIILKKSAGVPSAADDQMDQSGFERAMAALETVLFDRVERREVPSPIGRNRWIMNPYYWRKRLPQDGAINSRQFHLIEELWTALRDRLPEDRRDLAYLAGIIRKATGKADVGLTALTSAQAGFVIDALQDRLAHAVALPRHELAGLPF